MTHLNVATFVCKKYIYSYAETFNLFSKQTCIIHFTSRAMFLTIQNDNKESFYLVKETKNVLEQSGLKKSSKLVVMRPSNVSSSSLYGSLPCQACVVYHNQQYVLDYKLLSHPKATYLIDRIEAVGSKHYIGVLGQRYSVYPAT